MSPRLLIPPEAYRRLWTSQVQRAPPCPLHPLPRDPVDPQGGGGSRRSHHLLPWLAGRRGRSANPPVRAPPWGVRLAECASPLTAPARSARVRSSLAPCAAATRAMDHSRPAL